MCVYQAKHLPEFVTILCVVRLMHTVTGNVKL